MYACAGCSATNSTAAITANHHAAPRIAERGAMTVKERGGVCATGVALSFEQQRAVGTQRNQHAAAGVQQITHTGGKRIPQPRCTQIGPSRACSSRVDDQIMELRNNCNFTTKHLRSRNTSARVKSGHTRWLVGGRKPAAAARRIASIPGVTCIVAVRHSFFSWRARP